MFKSKFLSLAVLKNNFINNWVYYLSFTVVGAFYLIVDLLTNGFISDEQTPAEASKDINTASFIILWIICFFDYISLANKIFFKNIKEKKEQFLLLSNITRNGLFISNFVFLLFYSFSRMLIFFIIILTTFAIQDSFIFKNIMLLLFNITVNSLFVAMVFVSVCLLTSNVFSNQFVFISIVSIILIIATSMTGSFYDSTGTKKTLLEIIIYFPLFGMTSTAWINNNQWQQYLVAPVSISGIILFGYGNLKLNQRIEY